MKTINLHFVTNYSDTKTETTSKRNKYTHDNNLWNNLTIDYDKNPDYYIIQNHPGDRKYVPEKTLLFYNEPILTRKRWINWTKSQKFFHNFTERNWTGWGLSWSYDDFMTKPIFKLKENEKIISTVTSDLCFYPGHLLRLNFLPYLDTLDSVIYGKCTKGVNSPLHKLKNYKGPLKYNKDQGVFPYYYHFAAENSQEDGYFSEKLIDPILAESLCFYWGCNNVKNYIPEKAFIQIDITRPRQSLSIIKTAIDNDYRNKRLKIIKQAKKKILTELSIMPVIDRIINNK